MPSPTNVSAADPLSRFAQAQEGRIEQAFSELRSGRKLSHWMWFVFPQIQGLGRSETAIRFSLSGLDEARAYLAHPVLGPRLREAAALAIAIPDKSAREAFGDPDDLKLRSCLTLFALAAPSEPLFAQGLERFFGGAPDPATVELARAGSSWTRRILGLP